MLYRQQRTLDWRPRVGDEDASLSVLLQISSLSLRT